MRGYTAPRCRLWVVEILKQFPALTGHKIIWMGLGGVALIWVIAGFNLWLIRRQAAHWPTGLIEAGNSAWLAPGVLSLLSMATLCTLLIAVLGRVTIQLRQHSAEQLELQRQIIEHAAEAMMVTDQAHRILTVNPAFEKITGYSASEAIGQTPRLLRSGRHGQAFYQTIWARIAANGQWEGEIWDRHKNGTISPWQMRIQAVRKAEQQTDSHYIAVFTDLGTPQTQQAHIDYLAHHDPLTSLPNRLAMNHQLAEIIAAAAHAAHPLAVILIDLDNFKTINDSLGHHAGDHLLNEMARRLAQALGESVRLYRLGGDEFVVLLEAPAQMDSLAEYLQAIVGAISQPCAISGHQLHVSPSIGISLYPADGADAETLIRNADTAMYYAKANGRNNYQFFAEPMNAAANKRLHLESELWQALADEQLVLDYQPQIDLQSGKVVGVEALVRWLHPQRGLIAPIDFIPIAEACGLILPLGHWVLHTACRQAKTWLDAGVDIGEMAVNISALQFRQPEFAESVRAVLLETGLPAAYLELEITESTVMHSADSSVLALSELKAMGIKLAIDDFGTGYSSLSYLRRFPVDRLKIDRSFVADIESDPDAAALVTSIIAMAGSLGLHLVAEGVENSAQASFLRGLSCQRGQGFHFFRPVSAHDVEAISALAGGD